MNKHTISLPLAAVWTLIIAILTGSAAYFGTVNAQNEKIKDITVDYGKEFSADRQRISSLETDIRVIKDAQLESRGDIKELLRLQRVK